MKKSLKEIVQKLYLDFNGIELSDDDFNKALKIADKIEKVEFENQKKGFDPNNNFGSNLEIENLKETLENCTDLESKRDLLVKMGFIKDNRVKSQRNAEKNWGKTPVPFSSPIKTIFHKPNVDSKEVLNFSPEELKAETENLKEGIRKKNFTGEFSQ